MRRLMGIPLRRAELVCAVALLAVPIAPRIAWAGDEAISSARQTGEPGDSLPAEAGPGAGGRKSGGEMKDKRPPAALPAGVHAARMIGAGEIRLMYAPTYTVMRDNYVGSSPISPTSIVAIPYSRLSVFETNAPPTLRIVPLANKIQLHRFTLTFGVTDIFNILVMGAALDKNMSLQVYRGPMGATPLSTSTTVTEGFGDMAVQALVRLYQDDIHHVHVNLGLGLPTGTITQVATSITPSGAYATKRCCYGMQLGTGTVDGLFGVTYTGRLDAWSWGFAYRGRVAFGENSANYHYGPRNEITGWGGYEVLKGLSLTARAAATVWDRIRGSDPLTFGPMQGANPEYYGGERVLLLGGIEYALRLPGFKPLQLAIEAGAPVYQRLNGPQLGQDWELNARIAYKF